ncbi:PREDICTED: sperm acrosome membrane-associated protein 6-like [Myotis brandtii]|uniref:sperm acrosome membrane-associated protein 6-like n=1 Tax=Myotis brandtii TaxID=109478 RepID=UPI00070435A9|nr:PREDICTED: sperm acrosome membrane-associated protein 6-like [Myotis brandtii]
MRLPSLTLQRKCGRPLRSLKKFRPASLPAGCILSRRFRCRGCYSKVCDLPLDCPVQDVTVRRGDQAMFSCTVNFQLPKEEITYSWKFAEGGVSRGGARAKVFWRRVRLH